MDENTRYIMRKVDGLVLEKRLGAGMYGVVYHVQQRALHMQNRKAVD